MHRVIYIYAGFFYMVVAVYQNNLPSLDHIETKQFPQSGIDYILRPNSAYCALKLNYISAGPVNRFILLLEREKVDRRNVVIVRARPSNSVKKRTKINGSSHLIL